MYKNHTLAKLSHKKFKTTRDEIFNLLHRLLRSYIVGGACYYHIKSCTDQAVLLFDRWMEDETNLYVVKIAFLDETDQKSFQYKLVFVIEKYRHPLRILIFRSNKQIVLIEIKQMHVLEEKCTIFVAFLPISYFYFVGFLLTSNLA